MVSVTCLRLISPNSSQTISDKTRQTLASCNFNLHIKHHSLQKRVSIICVCELGASILSPFRGHESLIAQEDYKNPRCQITRLWRTLLWPLMPSVSLTLLKIRRGSRPQHLKPTTGTTTLVSPIQTLCLVCQLRQAVPSVLPKSKPEDSWISQKIFSD